MNIYRMAAAIMTDAVNKEVHNIRVEWFKKNRDGIMEVIRYYPDCVAADVIVRYEAGSISFDDMADRVTMLFDSIGMVTQIENLPIAKEVESYHKLEEAVFVDWLKAFEHEIRHIVSNDEEAAGEIVDALEGISENLDESSLHFAGYQIHSALLRFSKEVDAVNFPKHLLN